MTPATLAKAFIVALGLQFGCQAGAHAQALKIGVIAPLTGGGAPWDLVAAHAADRRSGDECPGRPRSVGDEVPSRGGRL
ncbi:hypothetical protein [Cupriavidus alkaliphilus]|uniref:hypothetical protein n=1 Tax=Cupriavidus alkaliphilus TaxID=942866 RepID=UPI00160851C8|nr:hypothetical protein [Cupriavidus alkaliphilus]MBB3014068.1 hypothetical protein [Cupriavidus alkaliphilus]